jgi:hypothetical protein
LAIKKWGNIKRMGAYVCQGHPETVRKEAEWKGCIFLKNIFFQHFKILNGQI